MASSTAAAFKGPRYAPPDPTLPKPWRALIDGNTGYLYFWNPETKAVQYERPAPAAPAPAPPVFSTPQSLPPGYGGTEERARSSAASEVATIPFPSSFPTTLCRNVALCEVQACSMVSLFICFVS
jgi:hypothetical protein